jgi:hypothetical protein
MRLSLYVTYLYDRKRKLKVRLVHPLISSQSAELMLFTVECFGCGGGEGTEQVIYFSVFVPAYEYNSISFRINKFLDFLCHPVFKRMQRFGNGISICPQVEGIYSVGSLRKWMCSFEYCPDVLK